MAQKIELKGKSFLTLKDFSKEEIKYFLSLASYLKTKKKIGIKDNLLEGKNIALIFEKASTRTKTSRTFVPYLLGKNWVKFFPKTP